MKVNVEDVIEGNYVEPHLSSASPRRVCNFSYKFLPSQWLVCIKIVLYHQDNLEWLTRVSILVAHANIIRVFYDPDFLSLKVHIVSRRNRTSRCKVEYTPGDNPYPIILLSLRLWFRAGDRDNSPLWVRALLFSLAYLLFSTTTLGFVPSRG